MRGKGSVTLYWFVLTDALVVGTLLPHVSTNFPLIYHMYELNRAFVYSNSGLFMILLGLIDFSLDYIEQIV